MAAKEVERVRLQLFGPVRLFAADGTDVTPRGQKVLGLLALLGLARDGRLARVTAASRLWSGSHDAKANLRQCLRELRRALDAAGPGLLRTDDYELVLDRERLAVDALALDGVESGEATIVAAFDDDCLLRDLEISDPIFDEWLTLERGRWRDRLHQALESQARARLAVDDSATAIALASRLVGFEPTLEAAHRVLMQGHAAQGNASLALRQFELCRGCLASELGVAPSAATMALRAAIARPPQRPQPSQTADTAGSAENARQRAVQSPAARTRSLAQPTIRIGLAAFRVLSPESGDYLYAVVLGEAIGAALALSTSLAVIDETVPLPAGCHGSVARLNKTLRLTVRLSSATDRRLLWAEHFRLETPDDDETLDRLAGLIAARLERAAIWHNREIADRPALASTSSTCEWRQAGSSIEAVIMPADL
jgi:DNA-binding SARP family transcriptional activator